MADLNLEVAEVLKYVGWAAVGLTVISTLISMRRARKWKPVGIRLITIATIGSALTLSSLLWTHRGRAWLVPTLALVIAGVLAGWVTSRNLNVRSSTLGAVAKRSALWAAVWGAGLATIQVGSVSSNLDLIAPAVAAVGLASGALLGVGIRLVARSRKLPAGPPKTQCPRCNRALAVDARFCAACGTTVRSVPQVKPPPPPPPTVCRQCRTPLEPHARFCSSCGVAVLQVSPR